MVFTSNRYVNGVNMKITIMFHDKRPFCPEPRTFVDYDYSGKDIGPILAHFQDLDVDIYIYPYGTTIDNYKNVDPIVSQVRRRQGYLVINTLAWRRFYESNH